MRAGSWNGRGPDADAGEHSEQHGELVDKITILEIKTRHISDPAKLGNVRRELDLLTRCLAGLDLPRGELETLRAELLAVNQELWRIEDEIRLCERDRDFGDGFVALARAVYTTNDRQFAIKSRINALAGSEIVEEKSYEPYD